MIYTEEHVDRIVHEKFKLREQVEVLTQALKETQRQLDFERTLRETLSEALNEAREGRDDD